MPRLTGNHGGPGEVSWPFLGPPIFFVAIKNFRGDLHRYRRGTTMTKPHYSLKDVAEIVGVKAHRIAYAISNGYLAEPSERLPIGGCSRPPTYRRHSCYFCDPGDARADPPERKTPDETSPPPYDPFPNTPNTTDLGDGASHGRGANDKGHCYRILEPDGRVSVTIWASSPLAPRPAPQRTFPASLFHVRDTDSGQEIVTPRGSWSPPRKTRRWRSTSRICSSSSKT